MMNGWMMGNMMFGGWLAPLLGIIAFENSILGPL